MENDVRTSNQEIFACIKDIITCLTTCKTTEVLLENIHSTLTSITYADNFYVVLKDPGNNISFPYFADTQDDFTNDELNDLHINDLKATLTHFALLTNKPCNFTFNDIVELQNSDEIDLLGTTPQQWLCYPLINKGKSLGAFVIQSYRSSSEYSPYICDVLLAISHIIASALDAFNSQKELELANEELNENKKKLNSLVIERTNEFKLKKEELEVEILKGKETQAELEHNLKALENAISDKKLLQKKLEFEATKDNLTGLANRKALYNAINRITARNLRNNQKLFIMYLDIDGFKEVNDSLGHDAGDVVLMKVGQRILSHIREYDLVARVSGDEFVVLIECAENKNSIHLIAKRIIDDIQRPIEVFLNKINLSISIGIASSNNPYHIENKLLRYADNAMYQAKKQGSGNVVWFDDSL